MNPPQTLDPVSVAVALIAVGLSPQIAALIGPYAVIILAATTGAAWSLGKRDPATRSSAVWYFLKLNATAVLLVVGLATLVTQMWPAFTGVHWMLAPISLLVGGVGDDWPDVGRWVVGRLGRLIDNRTGGQQP